MIFIYYSATRAYTAREKVRDEGGDGGGGDTLVYGYKVGQMLTMRTAKLKRPITPHRATTPPLPAVAGRLSLYKQLSLALNRWAVCGLEV